MDIATSPWASTGLANVGTCPVFMIITDWMRRAFVLLSKGPEHLNTKGRGGRSTPLENVLRASCGFGHGHPYLGDTDRLAGNQFVAAVDDLSATRPNRS